MKSYAHIVSLTGAKSLKTAFRDDDDGRKYAVAEARNMLVTKEGTLATRFPTNYECQVILATATAHAAVFVLYDSVADTECFIVGPCNSKMVHSFINSTLNDSVDDDFFDTSETGVNDTDLDDAGYPRFFVIQESDGVRIALYRHPWFPDGEGFPILDSTDGAVDWRSAFYDGEAVDQCLLIAGDCFTYIMGESLSVTGAWAVAASGSDAVVTLSNNGWHADYKITEALILGLYCYICVYHGGVYAKWVWWTGQVIDVDETGDPNFDITIEAPEKCFVYDTTGSIPATMELDDAYEDGDGDRVFVVFSACPILHHQPNYITQFQGRILLCYDQWLVGTTVGAGFAFDSRGLDDHSFALELKEEYGTLYWVQGITDLVLGTSNGVYKLSLSAGLSATTIEDVARQSSTACADIEPAWLGDYVCFVGSDFRHIYQVKYSSDEEQYITECLNNDFNIPAGTKIRKIVSYHYDKNYLFCLLSDGTLATYVAATADGVGGWGITAFQTQVIDLQFYAHTGEMYFFIRDSTDVVALKMISGYEDAEQVSFGSFEGLDRPADGISQIYRYKEIRLALDMMVMYHWSSYGTMTIVDAAAPVTGEIIDVTFPVAVGCAENDKILVNDAGQYDHNTEQWYETVFTLKNVTENGAVWECDLYDEAGTTAIRFAATDNWPASFTAQEAIGGELTYLEEDLVGGFNGLAASYFAGYYRRNYQEDWQEDESFSANQALVDGTVDTGHYGRDYIVGMKLPVPYLRLMRPPSFGFVKIRTTIADIGLHESGSLVVGPDIDNTEERALDDDVINDTAEDYYTGVIRAPIDDHHGRQGEIYIGAADEKTLEVTGVRVKIVGEEED